MTSDALGDRMKTYEVAARTTLTRRMPVIIRVDGKAFHTWTRGCERPFDNNLIGAMNHVAMTLCQEVEGTVLAYVQSDEISLLLHNYKRLQTQPWFDNQVQKMVSVAASIASAAMTFESVSIFGGIRPAHFDARAFLLPEAEVANYFLWRQQDASRNSIQMLARSLYSHKELHQKSGPQLQEMCFSKDYNWNDLPTYQRRGRCIVKIEEHGQPIFEVGHDKPVSEGPRRTRWVVDNEIPLFNQDRAYIERHFAVMDEGVERAVSGLSMNDPKELYAHLAERTR